MSECFIHDKALVASSAQIGKRTRVWAFANIQDDVVIGQDCNICDGCFIEQGVTIGDHVTLKNHVNVFKGITLKDDVFCGANVAFINDRNPRSCRSDQWHLEETIVHQGATIGGNATILCGLVIGAYAFIGAGSVVTKDVGPHTLVYGNPAEFKGYMCRCGRKLTEDLGCSCGLFYEKVADGGVALKS